MSIRYRNIRYVVSLVATLAAGCSLLSAQGDALYTQYQFNKLAINPGYAGSHEGLSIALVYRDQWHGIDGAPKTASLALHAPVGDRIGLGLHLVDDRLGIVEETGAWGSFAFRIPTGTGEFSIGVNGGASLYQTTLGGTFIVDGNDPVPTADQQLWLPNVGVGLYYHTDRFYFGLAAPRLIDNDLRQTSAAMSGAQSCTQIRHFNIMTGFVFDLGENVKMRPAGLIRYMQNTPVQSEFNLSLLFVDRFWVGAGYRSGGSLDSYVEFNITQSLRVGYSYDWVVNELGPQTGGSHEFLLGVDLVKKKKAASSPRQFLPSYF